MHKPQKQVRDFIRAVTKGPTSPAPAALRDATLRARLIAEEAAETIAALVGWSAAQAILTEFARKTKGEPDVVETVDGLCDLIYVAYGTAEAVGVDLEPFFDEVHRTNMAKTGEAVDTHGKRGGKPAGWRKPDIRGLLDAHEAALAVGSRR